MYGPSSSPEREILALVNEIPKAFIRLSTIADFLLADLGVAGPGRGVMRDLFIDGERTAPDLARAKPVTRQAIQPVLDDLVAKGLVAAHDNPRHQRSKIYALTPAGIEICVEIERREVAEIRRWMGEVGPFAVAEAAETLKVLNRALLASVEARTCDQATAPVHATSMLPNAVEIS